jgi:hypothetical protein
MVIDFRGEATGSRLQGTICAARGRVESLINTASPFVCLLNIIDGHVNSALGPETHNGAKKWGWAQ